MSDDWFDSYRNSSHVPERKPEQKIDDDGPSLIVECYPDESSRSIHFVLDGRSLPGYQDSLYFLYDGNRIYNTKAVRFPVLSKVQPPLLRSFLNELLEVTNLEVQEFGVRSVKVRYGLSQSPESVTESFEFILKKTLGIDRMTPIGMF
jgi:hypothetical protein